MRVLETKLYGGNNRMNVYQKLVELQKSTDAFVKDAKSYGYKYVSGSQVLGQIKETKDKLGLVLIPQITSQTTEKDGKLFIVKGELIYQWVNAEEPEDRLSVSWAYFGAQEDISKAFGSALTYAERYFLLKSLGIPTDEEDPDFAKKPEIRETAEPRETTEPRVNPGKAYYTMKEASNFEKTVNTPTTNEPVFESNFTKLKKLAEGHGKKIDFFIELSKAIFGTDRLNTLSPEQVSRLVSEIQPKQASIKDIDEQLPF